MPTPDNASITGAGGTLDRRRFLQALTLGAGGAALGVGCSGGPASGALERAAGVEPDPAATPFPPPPVDSIGPSTDRTLVIIELEGGVDGLDIAVPVDDGAYFDLRPSIGVDPDTLIDGGDGVALNGNLVGLAASGVAVLEGVGMPDPDLSHFESSRRWWTGDMAGGATFATGFLGRMCDQLARDEPVTGVSIGRGAAPTMRSDHAVTLSVPDPWAGGGLTATDWPFAMAARHGLATMAGGTAGTMLQLLAQENLGRAVDFLDVLGNLPERETDRYPGSQISSQLQTCARLLAGDTGVRVLHVPWGSFDTHDDHRGSLDDQLMELDEAVSAFRADLDDLGIADTTLIATTSEFGRRPAENAAGTDHGTASTMVLAGPVVPGRHGQRPSLTDLDDGNLVATVGMDEYYATLSEAWFGIPANEVLPGPITPIDGVIRTA